MNVLASHRYHFVTVLAAGAVVALELGRDQRGPRSPAPRDARIRQIEARIANLTSPPPTPAFAAAPASREEEVRPSLVTSTTTPEPSASVVRKRIERWNARIAGEQNALAAAERLLADPNHKRRVEGIKALRDHPGSPAARAAAERMLSDPSSEVREAALGTLAKIGNRSTARAIIPLLRSANPREASRAASVLGEIADPSAVAALVEALGHPDPSVQESALHALAGLADHGALEKVVPLLSSPVKKVRVAAIRAVEALGTAADSACLQDPLRDPDLEIRAYAAKAAAALGDSQEKARVLKAAWDLTSSESPDERSLGAKAVGILGQAGDIPRLRALMLADDARIVKDAAEAAIERINGYH
ncbi:MAG: HEAT repeat domain-containing protein [Planctomycetes bacterium]|nr:HEAT repeat domain-containing protein [Planctomycetota bacterium]